MDTRAASLQFHSSQLGGVLQSDCCFPVHEALNKSRARWMGLVGLFSCP